MHWQEFPAKDSDFTYVNPSVIPPNLPANIMEDDTSQAQDVPEFEDDVQDSTFTQTLSTIPALLKMLKVVIKSDNVGIQVAQKAHFVVDPSKKTCTHVSTPLNNDNATALTGNIAKPRESCAGAFSSLFHRDDPTNNIIQAPKTTAVDMAVGSAETKTEENLVWDVSSPGDFNFNFTRDDESSINDAASHKTTKPIDHILSNESLSSFLSCSTRTLIGEPIDFNTQDAISFDFNRGSSSIGNIILTANFPSIFGQNINDAIVEASPSSAQCTEDSRPRGRARRRLQADSIAPNSDRNIAPPVKSTTEPREMRITRSRRHLACLCDEIEEPPPKRIRTKAPTVTTRSPKKRASKKKNTPK